LANKKYFHQNYFLYDTFNTMPPTPSATHLHGVTAAVDDGVPRAELGQRDDAVAAVVDVALHAGGVGVVPVAAIRVVHRVAASLLLLLASQLN
jgi:hypothetical protein